MLFISEQGSSGLADGTLMLRLQREEDGVQVTCDMIKKDGNV